MFPQSFVNIFQISPLKALCISVCSVELKHPIQLLYCGIRYGGNHSPPPPWWAFLWPSLRWRAPSCPRWGRRKWPNGPWLPEHLWRTAFFESQSHDTLSCGEERGRLKGALRHFGDNLALLMLPYQATGGLISGPHDPRCSVAYSHSDFVRE